MDKPTIVIPDPDYDYDLDVDESDVEEPEDFPLVIVKPEDTLPIVDPKNLTPDGGELVDDAEEPKGTDIF